MHLIDTNIFVEIYLDQGKSQECIQYLTKVGKGEIKAVTTLFHADAVAIVLENESVNREDLLSYYDDLGSFRGLHILEIGFQMRPKALLENESLTLDDSLIIQVLKDYDVETLVSYDDDFDSFEDVERKTPSEVLEK